MIPDPYESPTLSTEQAASLLGCNKQLLYDLNARGQAPVEPLMLGRRLRWPTAKLLDLLGLGRDTEPPPTGDSVVIGLPVTASAKGGRGGGS